MLASDLLSKGMGILDQHGFDSPVFTGGFIRVFFGKQSRRWFLLRVCVIFQWLLFASVSFATDNREFLTPDQHAWLNSHVSELSMAPEANYPPFSFVDAGTWRGMSADMVKLMEGRLGIKFSTLPPQNLNAILVHAQRGEVGIVTSLRETPERAEYLAFTQPYVSIPTVVIVKTGARFGNWPDAFSGKQVAVGKGYGVQRYLEKHYPNIQLVPVVDDQEGLHRLSFGEVDAVIMDVASASFLIERGKLTNLHVFGGFEYTYDLSFAVRKDLPILRDILSRTLEAIPDRDKQVIARKWHISPDFSEFLWVRYQPYWPIAVTVVFMIATIGVLAWRGSLRRSISIHDRRRRVIQPPLLPPKGQHRYWWTAGFVLLIAMVVLSILGRVLQHTYQKNLNAEFFF